MLKSLGWKHLINAEVTTFVVLISSWHFPRRVSWWWYLELKGNWSPMIPRLFAIWKTLLITSVGSLGNGSYRRPPCNLFLGVVFYTSSLFAHIHILGSNPSFKIWFVGPLVLAPSSSSSPPQWVLHFSITLIYKMNIFL